VPVGDQTNALPNVSAAALDKLVDQLQQSGEPAQMQSEARQTGPVTALSDKPVSEPALTASDEVKDYSGEFYPVAHPNPALRNRERTTE
jgi:hypothetical protein